MFNLFKISCIILLVAILLIVCDCFPHKCDDHPQRRRYKSARRDCNDIKCTLNRYQYCDMEDGEPKCKCNDRTTGTDMPICATDGRDYPNPSTMWVTACLENRTIGIAYNGFCSTTESPSTPKSYQLDEDNYYQHNYE